MIIPKEIESEICKRCEMYRLDKEGERYCASYPRECSDISDYLYNKIKKIKQEEKNETTKAQNNL